MSLLSVAHAAAEPPRHWPSSEVPGNSYNLLDMLPHMRNELAHGSTYVMPFATPDMIRLGAEIINKLFRAK